MGQVKKCKALMLCACLGILLSLAFGGASAFAEGAASGIVSDSNNIRWEYQLAEKDGVQELSIMFYDKPANLATVTVPSLADLKALVPGVSSSLDTYFLRNADIEGQNGYSEYTRRAAEVSTTKLDMSNTAKIQIMGVQPIIDPNVETELVFGPDMVIGDVLSKRVIATVCTSGFGWNSRSSSYYCNSTTKRTFEGFESNIAGWSDMSEAEKESYAPVPEDFGCKLLSSVAEGALDTGACYLSAWNPGSYYTTLETFHAGGAFSGYKLKLTNFGDFNYLGWGTFANSTFADTAITINQSGLLGGDIFKNTNIKEATIETDNVGPGLFRDCAQLDTVHFGDSVTRVPNDTFAGTALTSLDFSQTNIKTIGARAFEHAALTDINFEGINKIEYGAFRYNDIQELYLPKSINYLESAIFYGNRNTKKLTVAYDTLTSGTTLPFFVVADGMWASKYDEDSPLNHIEEIVVLAPYAADEQVGPTHVSYDDYRWHYNCRTQEYSDVDLREVNGSVLDRDGNPASCSAISNGYGRVDYTSYSTRNNSGDGVYRLEDDYANASAYKNIIAPIYFYNFAGLKKITIGEGYEYIGSSAFWDQRTTDFSNGSWNDAQYSVQRSVSEVNLPESLKVIGNLAFGYLSKVPLTVNIPEGIEFIGAAAFTRNYFFEPDVDFPNLKYLGDHAFAGTKVKNVFLHDKTKYLGYGAFWGVMSIKNVTIDFDFFGSDVENYTVNGPGGYDGYDYKGLWFQRMFGSPWSGYFESYGGTCNLETHTSSKGFSCDTAGSYTSNKFETITFTDKVVSPFPSRTGDNDSISYSNGYLSETIRDTFFGFDFFADKVDISQTGWKVLPTGMFGYYSRIGEVVLPENLEVIAHHAFADTWIYNEIKIPDTVKIIGDKAFNMMAVWDNTYSGTYANYKSPKISKLPEGLEYVGLEAFYGDDNVTADLIAPNLKFVGARAFQGTKLHDVYIGDVQSLREGTFANIPSLHNITIDGDFGRAVTAEVDNSFDIPQSLLDMFDGDAEKAKNFVVAKGIADGDGDVYEAWNQDTGAYETRTVHLYGEDFETFYTIFNKTMKESTAGTRDGQATSGESFGELVFTDKNVTELGGMLGTFSFLTFDKVDMGDAKWKYLMIPQSAFKDAQIGMLVLPKGLENVTDTAFEGAIVSNAFELPATLKTIGRGSFQWADIELTNALPEGLEKIDNAAFYMSDFTDNLVIPGTVSEIGYSAFNAGGEDVKYDSVTIKPDLTNQSTFGQLVHQMFWGAQIDKMRIESSMLVGLERNAGPYNQEFYRLPISEIAITNLPGISYAAFDGCTKLEKVDMSENDNLRTIAMYAFAGDEKLKTIKFSDNIKTQKVAIDRYAFKDTAFETIGGPEADIDLTAAKFEGLNGYAFADMPKLNKVDIPENFSNGTVPIATFYNAPELTEVTVAYPISVIDDAAFANDNKLERIFIWGNTKVNDSHLAGYENLALNGGLGRIVLSSNTYDENVTPVLDDTLSYGPTIPEGTDIYAYATSRAEHYAGSSAREGFDGVFYPLDEVLYLTSNHKKVKLNEAGDDFDKTDITLYAMRRDGIIMESNEWGTWDGLAYPRSESGLNFEKMAEIQQENPVFGAIWDTPVPLDYLNFAYENFDKIDYELVFDEATGDTDADDVTPQGVLRKVNVLYTDGYTQYLSDTELDPYTEEDERNEPIIPGLPITRDNIISFVISLIVSVAAIVVLLKIARKKVQN